MAVRHEVLFILPLLFLAANAGHHKPRRVGLQPDFPIPLPDFNLPPDPLNSPINPNPVVTDDPFNNILNPLFPQDPNLNNPIPNNDPLNPPVLVGGDQGNNKNNDINDNNNNNFVVPNNGNNFADPNQDQNQPAKPDFETNSVGTWEMVNINAGVSAMHIQLLPNNKIYLYDATVFHISKVKLPPGAPCLPFVDPQSKPLEDCWAHTVEYDVETNKVVRPIRIVSDPWCSSGGVAPDGTLVSTGGFLEGTRAIRFLGACPDCQWREKQDAFKEDRWYATQAKLPNGEFIVMGGRRAFSWEFVPKEGQSSDNVHFFPFLYETSDLEENNLYPFVHLSIDGNLFIFSNNRSLLLNPRSNKIVRTFPVLPGGSRNYPASGMSALLPLKLNEAGVATSAEVIVCGGNSPEAFHVAETLKQYLPALQDCGRLVFTDRNPKWQIEIMPSRRTMGDLLNLPNGQLLFINGAQNGTSAWWDADVPNFTPVLYSPDKPMGQRFKVMAATLIPRMYHSSSAVLPNGKIWVSGSNTHDGYKDNVKYPTETRVENFSPPYLDPVLAAFRPEIVEATSPKQLKYNLIFETRFTMTNNKEPFTKNDIKVVMYVAPFTTHGFSMNQRQLVLPPGTLTLEAGGVYKIASLAPASGEVAPPGYYLLFVVHRGVPSKGMWVQIGQ